MQNIQQLASAVQTNCHISDARHAGDYGLCTFLLKMREYYRWENEIPLTRSLPKDDLGDWLAEREKLWAGLEARPFEPLPLSGGESDPFDNDAINRELVPAGYVYSGGYGRFHKPMFFLGRLLRKEERAGYTVYVSSCEYARDIDAPPAMLQGRNIFVREECVRRFLWEKIEEWRWNRQNRAMARFLAHYDFDTDPEAALERMTRDEIEAMILHELGEGRAGELLGEAWPAILNSLADARTEIMLRAVRDHLADCLATLPALTAAPNPPSLHFYFANYTGMRRELFPELLDAYRQWAERGDLEPLRVTVAQGADRWQRLAQASLRACDPPRAACTRALADLIAGRAPA